MHFQRLSKVRHAQTVFEIPHLINVLSETVSETLTDRFAPLMAAISSGEKSFRWIVQKKSKIIPRSIRHAMAAVSSDEKSVRWIVQKNHKPIPIDPPC